ncbi:uncharacterized protein LOC114520898 [Dendronephthya gigantea]|uniref:uncharacterized protein LOC114520898 n=1 Tax=Dendronephthya gigantea TaxID=151771 RepID=UPI00106A9812|nr:uncharacterized protein LOC114520898 [Dendronephthya gigantea]
MSVGSVVHHASPSNSKCLELGISRSCCRNLFGPIDHEQLRTELETELKRITDEKKRRWNFDFVKLKPLDGDFSWQRIGDNRSVGFATSDESNGRISDRITPQSNVVNTRDDGSNAQTRNATSNAQETCFRTPERLTAKRLRKSPRITDYLRAKKGRGTSRKIKFNGELAGVPKLCKRVQTRKASSGRPTGKQSTLDQYMPKLRPRQSNGKAQISR